jgi:hypothetical protein
MMKKTIFTVFLFLIMIVLTNCQPTDQEFISTQSVSGTVVPLPTATPVPTQVSLVTPDVKSLQEVKVVDIAYTQDNPVTDNQEIISILDDFLSRYLSQFSKSGWYYFPNNNQNRYWMHIPEKTDDNHFDMFLSTTEYHTYAPGFIWPFSIVLQDGSWGFSRLSPRLDDYQFNQGGKQPEVPLLLDNLDYYAGGSSFGNTSLTDFLDMLINPNRIENNVEISRTFSGWVEEEDGKEVFVLLIHETYSGMKPQLESSRQVVDHIDQYTYFDLQNGGRIYEKYVDFLEGGEVVEDDLQFNQHLVQYYEVLPEEIQTVYDEAAQKLRDYLEEQ